MPVRDLTERPQIPRLGKIRLGDQGGRNGSPRNLPHFVVPEEVAKVYSEEPTELNVVFLSDDLERIASQYYRAYNASSGLICKGDGRTADALLDADVLAKAGGELTVDSWAHGETGGRHATRHFQRQQITCAGMGYDGQPPCPMFAAKKCAIRGFFQFAIRDVPGLGVYQMDTGSTVSIRKLNGAFEMARAVLGGVAGVPMKLKRIQEEVSPDGKKKKVWMVALEVDTTLSLGKLLTMREGPVAQALLPPVDETEVYEAVEDEEDEEEDQATETEVVTPPAPEPEQAPPPAARAAREPVAPYDLLNEIAKRHGQDAKVAAINVMTRLYGTQVITSLNRDQRAEYATYLRFRLEHPGHQPHELAYTPDARAVCGQCGDEMIEPAEDSPAKQEAMPI